MNDIYRLIWTTSFQNIRESDLYYVDKTDHILRMVETPGYYLLSRPRRFGKSLLIDTIKELFEGNEKLFQGLYIHNHWDWTVKMPVIRLSFDCGYSLPQNLNGDVTCQLAWIEKEAGVESSLFSNNDGAQHLQELVIHLYHATKQQVVVLVDEYDKPLMDPLNNPELAKANCEYLRDLYAVVKSCANEIRFAFFTGLSMYSKANLFSGLKDLKDISLDPQYATIGGYTDSDIDTVFTPELVGLNRDKIRQRYRGYNWLGEENVYNHYDILILFEKREFKPHWYRTGTPSSVYTFILHMMIESRFNTLNLENVVMDEEELLNFDVENFSINSLLFQCGYLTITGREVRLGRSHYKLSYPNPEVRIGLNESLLHALNIDMMSVHRYSDNLLQSLADNDFESFEEQLWLFFSEISYQRCDHKHKTYYWKFYVNVLFACFIRSRIDIRLERSASRGSLELVVLHANQVFVLGFKAVLGLGAKAATKEAMRQMRGRGYEDTYAGSGKAVHYLALAFSRVRSNLAAVKVERA